MRCSQTDAFIVLDGFALRLLGRGWRAFSGDHEMMETLLVTEKPDYLEDRSNGAANLRYFPRHRL
jgi:hypothetical protein